MKSVEILELCAISIKCITFCLCLSIKCITLKSLYGAKLCSKRLNLKGEPGIKKREHRKANNKSRTQYMRKMFQELTFAASKSLITRHFELSVVLLGFEVLQSGFCVALRLYKSSSRQLLLEWGKQSQPRAQWLVSWHAMDSKRH